MLEPRPIRRAATTSGWRHPVVPFPWKAFGQQDPAADREAPKRDDLLTPTAVDWQRRGPARAVVLHQGDVQRLASAEAAEAQAELPGVVDGFVSRQHSTLDHERCRVVGRVHRQLEVKDRLTRRLRKRHTKEATPSRIADARER